MPVFEKNDRRVYFAHIPKTAGSAVYVAFLRGGWSLANIDSKNKPGRIGKTLAEDFGLTEIPFQGSRHGLDIVAQHAPAAIWSGWGPFTESFAICRNPFTRYMSSVVYRYHLKRRLVSERHFRRRLCRSLNRDFTQRGVPGEAFFRPQIEYVLPETCILRFEGSWWEELAARFDLPRDALDRVNTGRAPSQPLTEAEVDLVRRHYARDFETFGYEVDEHG